MTMLKPVNILIPTFKRLKALAVTLTSLYYQSEKDFDIIIADQSLMIILKKIILFKHCEGCFSCRVMI